MIIKHFVFVGGSHGISESVVQQVLQGHPDSVIHVFSRTAPLFLAEYEHRLIWESCDAFSEEAAIDLSAVPPESFAGYVYAPGSINLRPFTSLTTQDFQNDWDKNVLSNIRVLQKLIPIAKKSSHQPSFVFFSTIAAFKGMPMHASISASKAALEGLAKSLAAEYAPKMRFNVVAPSLTETSLSQAITSKEAIKKASEEKHPLKRIGQPQDVASSVVFLLSDQSSWMTGQVLRPDGGLSL